MTSTFQRRMVLLPVLVLLVAAWALAADPLAGRGMPELYDPEAVEELLERDIEDLQAQLLRLPLELGRVSLVVLLEQRPCAWDEVCPGAEHPPLEYLIGHCSISRAPPRG